MLTIEKLRQTMDSLDPLPRFDDPLRLRPLSFAGMDIYEAQPPAPVLQISPGFPYVSDKFRAEWNAWALERFGLREPLVPRNVAFQIGHRLILNRQSIVQLMNFAV